MFLVVGAAGQLGTELKNILGSKAEYVDRNELDITNADAVKTFFETKAYSVIINCAAYTAVDKAETEIKLAKEINVDGPQNLAATGIPLIHISTDYVFDGKSFQPYVEDDKINPPSIYGKTKAASEKVVFQTANTAIIIRTSWLYSPYGNNFVKTMQKLGAERENLNVVFEQIGTPTYAADLAQAIVDIIPQIKKGMKEIYHFSNEGVASWYDFAVRIMELSKLKCVINPFMTKDYPTLAPRPFYSVLNKAKIKNDFGIKINHWEKSLQICIERMKEIK
jgi:dTDP-4-dehydrorhamnose reductase